MTRWGTADVYLRPLPRSNILAHLSCNVGLRKFILVLSEKLKDTVAMQYMADNALLLFSRSTCSFM